MTLLWGYLIHEIDRNNYINRTSRNENLVKETVCYILVSFPFLDLNLMFNQVNSLHSSGTRLCFSLEDLSSLLRKQFIIGYCLFDENSINIQYSSSFSSIIR